MRKKLGERVPPQTDIHRGSGESGGGKYLDADFLSPHSTHSQSANHLDLGQDRKHEGAASGGSMSRLGSTLVLAATETEEADGVHQSPPHTPLPVNIPTSVHQSVPAVIETEQDFAGKVGSEQAASCLQQAPDVQMPTPPPGPSHQILPRKNPAFPPKKPTFTCKNPVFPPKESVSRLPEDPELTYTRQQLKDTQQRVKQSQQVGQDLLTDLERRTDEVRQLQRQIEAKDRQMEEAQDQLITAQERGQKYHQAHAAVLTKLHMASQRANVAGTDGVQAQEEVRNLQDQLRTVREEQRTTTEVASVHQTRAEALQVS